MAGSRKYEAEKSAYHEDFYNVNADDATCPECGVPLADIPDLEKHAVQHYGDEPLPVTPRTRLARQRQAALLGQEIPER